ncbi:MAG TPA: hypothetical protein VF017_04725 [Thermoanaerobaculia bacterium]|nr:hypothetical protein [Thermoanaerobaculia bacterium]
MPKRTGRPSKLTPEVQDRIVSAIRAGNYAQVAAGFAGIGESTFYRWMEQGERAEDGAFREFRDAVKRAEHEAEVRAVAIIQAQMPIHWQAAMTYLERKFPTRWGRRERVDVTSAERPLAGGVIAVPGLLSVEDWEQQVARFKAKEPPPDS